MLGVYRKEVTGYKQRTHDIEALGRLAGEQHALRANATPQSPRLSQFYGRTGLSASCILITLLPPAPPDGDRKRPVRVEPARHDRGALSATVAS
jgi:hypothetical protein